MANQVYNIFLFVCIVLFLIGFN